MSEVIDLDRKVYKFRLDGKVYDARKPNMKEVQELQAKTKGLESDDPANLDCMLELLDGCGIPSSVLKTAEPDHVQLIAEHLIGGTEKK